MNFTFSADKNSETILDKQYILGARIDGKWSERIDGKL